MKVQLLFLITIICLPYTAHTTEYNLTADSDCDVKTYATTYTPDNQTWGTQCDGIQISGDAICSSQIAPAGTTSSTKPPVDTSENAPGLNLNCWCKMTTPYAGKYWVSTGYSTTDLLNVNMDKTYAHIACLGTGMASLPSSCVWRCSHLWNQTKHYYNQEVMAYGYYTDENLAKVKAALFIPAPTETLCNIGISRLHIGANTSFSLYTERYTEPSMVIQTDNGQCYLKTAPSIGTNTLNIMLHDGSTYHIID